jgi:hypothetical protein
MKHIIFVSLIFISALPTTLLAQDRDRNEKKQQADRLAQRILLGRKAIIRVYNNWQAEPYKYQKVTVPLNGLSINDEAIKSAYQRITDSAVVVVMAGDQEDNTVAAVLGDNIFAEPYKPGKRISLWPKSLQKSEIKYCVFKDALGNPMADATAQIYRGRRYGCNLSPPLAVVQIDEQGRMKPPSHDPTLHKSCLVVTHPDYGTAIVEPELIISTDGPVIECTVPLVRNDTEEDLQSIRGEVIDNDGNPVAEVMITYNEFYSADGPFLRLDGYNWPNVKTITDSQGQFSLYVPVTLKGRRWFFPPGTQCMLSFVPLKQSGLIPCNKVVRVGQSSLITMSRALTSTPIFVFEDEFGPVTDENMLQQIFLKIENEGRSSGGWLKDMLGRSNFNFKPGTYYATANWYGKHYIFEPVTIEAEVNEPVVFKPARIELAERIYIGQVIHGVTGQPIADALVMKQPEFTDINCADLDPLEMKNILRSFGAETDLNSPEIMRLKEDFIATKMCLTDADGYFIISLPNVPEPPQEIIAVRKDFLGARQQLYGFFAIEPNGPPLRLEKRFQSDENGIVSLAPLKLFPAGAIIIKPIIPAEYQKEHLRGNAIYRRLRLYWLKFGEDKPAWFETMGDYTYPSRNNGASLFYKKDLLSNAVQKIYVASDLEMTLKIDLPVGSQWDPIIFTNIMLHQGEVLNLGRVEFGPAIKVAIMVVDSAGQAVEGVTVKQLNDKGKFWGRQSITNVNGIALLDVPRYSSGEFAVQKELERTPDGSWQMPLKEGVSYKVAGQEDNGRVFILKLSDDFLNILFE